LTAATRVTFAEVSAKQLFRFVLPRAHFDVVTRKLISEVQTCSQCIHETSMLRFYSFAAPLGAHPPTEKGTIPPA
jgi:hypothetical protein